MYKNEEIVQGFETAFINEKAVSNELFRPQFLSNNYRAGRKVLSSIEEELSSCDHFRISAAFITMSGITPLLQTLKELEEKNVEGEILTTNYLNFSEPKALKKLHEFKNIKLKMYDVESANEGFHTKGYIFNKGEIYKIIIGSSNITSSALMSNREWNTKIVSTENGEMTKQIVSEFEELWNSKYALDFEQFYDVYKETYEIIKKKRGSSTNEEGELVNIFKLQPNSMQVGFIENLKKIVNANPAPVKALLISATGTGKTYASAFALRELGYKRVLFIVHRGQLAKQSKRSYQRVFERSVSMGLVGAGHDSYDADFVFATVQTLSRDNHLFEYGPNTFDCIVMDEAHHVPANTYQKIMNHFKPKLWLGMTATPDKKDDHIVGRNVYELFDYNIAYEIRLQQAMEEKLLCNFHYFGITDLAMIDDETDTDLSFSMLTSDERVKHIVRQATYFGYSGDKVKGLIFCRGIKESEILSEKLNKTINPETGKYFRTLALNGSASEQERQEAFERLAMNENDVLDGKEPLDYILSFEILNEGVDIVEVNQVIMLRPTQSPIVFVQQLGRGLRKAEGKEYVVILDFIGNYKNNFMIPIALSGDRSYNKDNVRRYVIQGDRVIPGASTVHFDEISRKKIFASIDNTSFSDLKLLKENYLNLKNKLGRIPSLADFDDYGEMDVMRFVDNDRLGSYYKFLVKNEKEFTLRFDKNKELLIEFISKKFLSGKRIQELLILKRIVSTINEELKEDLFVSLANDLKEFNKTLSECQKTNIINILTNEFATGSSKNTYKDCIIIENNYGNYYPSKRFLNMLSDPEFLIIIEELVEYGISRYKKEYLNSYKDTDLVLYKKYTYEDVCRLLNWEQNVVSLNIGGYKFDKATNTYPVYINYEKSDDITNTTKYEDHFINNKTLIAISKSGRTIESEDVQNFIHSQERGIHVELFVRKNKDDKTSKEFYYLGRMYPSGNAKKFTMANTDKTAVEIEWNLEVPVREDIYKYIVNC